MIKKQEKSKKIKGINNFGAVMYASFNRFLCLLSSNCNTGISFHGVVQNIFIFPWQTMTYINRKFPS